MSWYLACTREGTATGEDNVSIRHHTKTESVITDVIDFFQSPLFSFRNPEEDQDKRGDVETAIKSPVKQISRHNRIKTAYA